MSNFSPHGRPLAIVVVLLVVIAMVVAITVLPSFLHREAPQPAQVAQVPSGGTPSSAPASAQPVGVVHWRPTSRTGSLKILDKKWFVIGYDERRENPAWVTYDLAGSISHFGSEPNRPAAFATDFDTSSHVSQHDYSGSGFDRGHMCPAYAMWSRGGADAFKATFVCSNIIPQPHRVNAGIWEDLETQVAGRWSSHGGQGPSGGWAEEFGSVTVINGPIYQAPIDTLRNGTVIPAIDFSVIIKHDGGHYQALAFEIPNAGDPRGPLDRYLVTIKRVEDDAGLDLFAGEPGALRTQLEDVLAPAIWN